MLSLEDQIKELADYAFETTEAVQFEPRSPEPTKKRGFASPLLAVAAVLVVLVGGILVGRDPSDVQTLAREQTELILPADTELDITDPLDINLDPLIESSDQLRLNAIGEYATFNFDQLPDGWSAEQNFAVTVQGSRGSQGTFWQQVLVSGPGPIRLVVNVTGALDRGAALLYPEFVAAEGPTVLGGREIYDLGRGTIRWVEDGTSQVEIANRALGLMTGEEALELAGYLVPLTTELNWQLEARPLRAEPFEEWRQLSGKIDGMVWHVTLDGGRLVLNAEPDFAGLGDPFPIINGFNPSDPTKVLWNIESVDMPGGVVLFGHAPEIVDSVRLRLLNGTAVLPVVGYHTDRVAFAVPISDRLDPLSVEFLDPDGVVVFETISLSDLPPYSG